jgi:hypothetical protein
MNREELLELLREAKEEDVVWIMNQLQDCDHQCSSNCRRNGCNCDCGEWHKAYPSLPTGKGK